MLVHTRATVTWGAIALDASVLSVQRFDLQLPLEHTYLQRYRALCDFGEWSRRGGTL